MTFQQALKNVTGSLLWYGSCPVTGDTYWRQNNLMKVPYAPNRELIISPRALLIMPLEELAERIHRWGVQHHYNAHSLDDIMAHFRNSITHNWEPNGRKQRASVIIYPLAHNRSAPA